MILVAMVQEMVTQINELGRSFEWQTKINDMGRQIQ